jgi:hypothetical protein
MRNEKRNVSDPFGTPKERPLREYYYFNACTGE